MSKQHLFALSLIFTLCACAPIAISPTTAQPSPAQPTASPSPSIIPNPLPEPTVSPTAVPTPTSTPVAQATADLTLTPKTSYKGSISNSQGQALSDVVVNVSSLNSSLIYEVQTRSVNGQYAFNNAPPGVQLMIRVSKAGYIPQIREVVLKANHEGNPNDPLFNRFDFTLALDPNSSPQP